MNDSTDGRLAGARLAFTRAEAARLGRELREHREGLALLPAFGATKVFEILYEDSYVRDAARLGCFAHIVKGYWWLFAASIAASAIIWYSNQTMLPVLAFHALNLTAWVVLTYFVSSQRNKIRDDLVKDLRVLQGILGNDIPGWPDNLKSRSDLEDMVEGVLIVTLLSTGLQQIVDRWILTATLVQQAEESFHFDLCRTKTVLARSREEYRRAAP